MTVFNRGNIAFYYRNGVIGAGGIISDVIINREEWYRNVELLTPQLKNERNMAPDETRNMLNVIRQLYGLASITLQALKRSRKFHEHTKTPSVGESGGEIFCVKFSCRRYFSELGYSRRD